MTLQPFVEQNRWGTGSIIKMGAKLEFCINEKGKPSEVHYGEVIGIDYHNKSFTFKEKDGRVFEGVTAIRGVGRIENWNKGEIK